MGSGTGEAQGLQVLNASSFGGRRLRDVDQRLRRLPVRYGRDDTVRRGIDRGHRIAIDDPYLDVCPSPEGQMPCGECAHRDVAICSKLPVQKLSPYSARRP